MPTPPTPNAHTAHPERPHGPPREGEDPRTAGETARDAPVKLYSNLVMVDQNYKLIDRDAPDRDFRDPAGYRICRIGAPDIRPEPDFLLHSFIENEMEKLRPGPGCVITLHLSCSVTVTSGDWLVQLGTG